MLLPGVVFVVVKGGLMDELLHDGDELLHLWLIGIEHDRLIVPHDYFNVLNAEKNRSLASDERGADLLRDRGVHDAEIAKRKTEFIRETLFIDLNRRYLP